MMCICVVLISSELELLPRFYNSFVSTVHQSLSTMANFAVQSYRESIMSDRAQIEVRLTYIDC